MSNLKKIPPKIVIKSIIETVPTRKDFHEGSSRKKRSKKVEGIKVWEINRKQVKPYKKKASTQAQAIPVRRFFINSNFSSEGLLL